MIRVRHLRLATVWHSLIRTADDIECRDGRCVYLPVFRVQCSEGETQ